ncbi:DUF3099 domain-containing protein [Streptomyces sp. NPDC013455]|uniref:DUF3099 domain-containing protein n=1 Tax=Streptomyces sp. NPDC013455 TaxID=3155605 RepID=UPI0034114028
MRKRHGGDVQVFRITGARTSLAEDVRGRQRRYVISMSVRTVSVILAVSLWNVERYVAIVALVLGAVLPYVAVVIANAGREKPPSLPSTFVTAPMRPMIAPPGADGAAAAPPGSNPTSGSGTASGPDTTTGPDGASGPDTTAGSRPGPGSRPGSAPDDVPAAPAAGARAERPDPA